MLKKMIVTSITLGALLAGAVSTHAQQTEGSKSAPQQEKAVGAYRLDYLLSEMEDGKKINTRQYSMHAQARDWAEIRIGSRVPVETKGDEWQYLDVGTNIRCRLTDQADTASLDNNVYLSVHAELSNFAMPEQQDQTMHPTIRQMRIDASTIAVLGKPTLVGVVDDPNSRRSFQLEVTVAKLH